MIDRRTSRDRWTATKPTFVTTIRFRHDVDDPLEANAEAQHAVELLRDHGYHVFLRSTMPPPAGPASGREAA